MTTGDEYRGRAANLRAKAQRETNAAVRTEFERLALSYLRLAEQAERNSLTDVVYEWVPPSRKDSAPDSA